MGTHLATAWESLADLFPDDRVVSCGPVSRTWAEFDQRAARLASAFAAAGLAPGSPVAIDLYNCNEFLESHFAALKGRYVPVHLNYRYLDDELGYLLEDCRAEALVFHSSLGARIGPLARRLPQMRLIIEVDDPAVGGLFGGSAPGDPAKADGVVFYEELIAANDPAGRIRREDADPALAYTGGTTGMPKGVRTTVGAAEQSLAGQYPTVLALPEAIPHNSVVAAAHYLRQIGQSLTALPASPLMHSTAMAYGAVPALSLGGAVVTVPNRRLDAHRLLDTVADQAVTNMTVVGDAVARPILDALEARAAEGRRGFLDGLRVMASAGVAWSAGVKGGLLRHAPHLLLVDSCGSSEGAWFGTSMVRSGDDLSATRFRAAPGVIVVDDDDRPVPTGVPGLIAAPAGLQHYSNDPDKTAKTFRVIGDRRYIMPGDVGILEEDGTIILVGRGTQVINTGGEKVYPQEVEDVIRSLPGVCDALVLGIPDPRWMQRVVAVVAGQPEPLTAAAGEDRLVPVGSEADLAACEDRVIAHVRSRLAAYKAPKAVTFVEAVPRLPNGKPDYASARVIAEGSAAG